MVDTNLCCMKEESYSFFSKLETHNPLIINILTKELFGDESVQCDFNLLNDLVYLKTKLDFLQEDVINYETGLSMNMPVGDKEDVFDGYCLEKTIEYFDHYNFNIRTVLDFYIN